MQFNIVGVVGNTCYDDLRDCAKPIVFMPYREAPGQPGVTTYVVFTLRTESQNPAVACARAARGIGTHRSFGAHSKHSHAAGSTRRANAAGAIAFDTGEFFRGGGAGAGGRGALRGAGVLRDSARREIGIRIAVGAQPAQIARTVIVTAYAMVILGAAVGLVAGAFAVRPLQSIFYEVKATDVATLALPAALILGAALLAALPAVVRAVRIDPVILLRSE